MYGYCDRCRTALEEHGHCNAGDYHTAYYACPKCGKSFDYDDRLERCWKPNPPLYDIDEKVPKRYLTRTEKSTLYEILKIFDEQMPTLRKEKNAESALIKLEQKIKEQFGVDN